MFSIINSDLQPRIHMFLVELVIFFLLSIVLCFINDPSPVGEGEIYCLQQRAPVMAEGSGSGSGGSPPRAFDARGKARQYWTCTGSSHLGYLGKGFTK